MITENKKINFGKGPFFVLISFGGEDGRQKFFKKNITKLNVMMICILQNHVCETIAVAAKSCYKYSGLPAYPLKVDFIVTLFSQLYLP